MRTRLAVILILETAAIPIQAGETGGRLRFQLGHEYDTNARRIFTPPDPGYSSPGPPADGLVRLILEGLLNHRGGRHYLAINYLGGAKLFFAQSPEDLLATRLSGDYGYSAAPGWSLGGRLLLHDTTQREHYRDYLQVRGEAYQRNRLTDWLDLEVFAGGQLFFFKPDEYAVYGSRRYSHRGPLGGVRLSLGGSREVRSVLFYEAGVRFFDDRARRLREGIFVESGEDRLDIRHLGGLRVRHGFRYWNQHRLILDLSYLISVNDSNSAGSSALWHRLRLVVSMNLPLDITLHLMGTLQFADYLDGVYVEGDLYEPDADENENSLALRLTVPLWKGLGAVLHGAIYRNDFHAGENQKLPFARETVMLGLAYDWSF